jgi:hypothetical protein
MLITFADHIIETSLETTVNVSVIYVHEGMAIQDVDVLQSWYTVPY